MVCLLDGQSSTLVKKEHKLSIFKIHMNSLDLNPMSSKKLRFKNVHERWFIESGKMQFLGPVCVGCKADVYDND